MINWNGRSTIAISAALTLIVAIGIERTWADDAVGRGRHAQLYAVPAPGPVTIDGRLDEWDLSGQIEMFVYEATRSTQHAKVALMYDDEALYVSGKVADPTPMMNRHDPQVNPHRAWDADAFQLRIVVDPEADYPLHVSSYDYRGDDAPEDTRDEIVHLTLWHYTDDAEAHMHMHVGMTFRKPHEHWEPRGLVPQEKFDGAYRMWDDETGYTFEYRIPWETLGAERALTGGDIVAGTVQVNWSRPDGLATGGTSAWAYDVQRTPGFPFQSTTSWGRIIFAEEGDVASELVREGVPPERPLPLEFSYELPADGETTVQLFDEDGTAARILVPQQERPGGRNTERWDGLDDSGELLPAGTYEWRGIFTPEPIRPEYRFSVHNSGNPPYPTDDNTGGWGADHGYPRDVLALPDGGMALSWSATEYGWGVIRIDSDGQKQWGAKNFANHMTTDGERLYLAGGSTFRTTPGIHMIDVEDSRAVRLDGGAAGFPPPEGGDDDTNTVTGLTYHDGTLYVAYGRRDRIMLYDTERGEHIDTWEIAAPERLAMRPDGSLAVVSQGQVLTINDGQATPWITTHLDEPAGIVVDDDGQAYVANQGELHDVSAFAADGTYQRSIGLQGGRPAMGAYDPDGMYMPGGVDLDARGRLWVAETKDYPKRISVWDAQSGDHLEEYFGGSSYFAYGHIDPSHPHEIYAHNVLWTIDWDNYTTEPTTTIWRRTEPNMAPHPNVSAHGGAGGFRLFTAADGTQFGWGAAGSARGRVLYIRDGDIYRPVAGIINPWRDEFPALEPLKRTLDDQWDEQRVAQHRRPRDLFWQDTTGDGIVHPDELTPLGRDKRIAWINKDLSMRLYSGHVLEPDRLTESGRPLYDLDDLRETPVVDNDLFRGFTMEDPDDGSVYTLAHRDGPSLIKWSPEGEKRWNYPNLIAWRGTLNLPTVRAGRLLALTRPMGVAGDYFAHQTYHGVMHLFRRDGQYVGALLDDTRLGLDGAYTGQPEGQGGAFVKLNIDGEIRYFVIGGGQDVRVWEVHGLDAVEDLAGGTYVHTNEKVTTAREAQDAYEAELAGEQRMHIVRGREALESAEGAGRTIEGGRAFEAQLAYDDEHLYVRYDVTAPHALVNAQGEPQIVFGGGNVLDIQIATDPQADPQRETPAPGDVRLVVTRQHGESLAVLYQPRVQGFEGEPIVLESPTGTESFHAIDVVDEVTLEYDEADTGFVATVAIPLELLDLELNAGEQVRMDLGYVFGNAGGTQAVARAYVNNNSFTANVTDDIPHESRIEPHEWGEALVE